MAEGPGVDIKTLTAAQLGQLGEQLEEELSSLGESFSKLQSAVGRFYQSGTVLEALAQETEGTAMMVPLTESLYAPGMLGSTDKVLLDIGTGYFVEFSPADGTEYCRRKVLLLRENVDKLGEIIAVKNRQMRQVQAQLAVAQQAAARRG